MNKNDSLSEFLAINKQLPIRADEALTRALKKTLALVDINVLDHMIVAGSDTLSFAEKGIL